MSVLPEELLFFDPIYHEKIWGGFSLKSKLNKAIPPDTAIGESWELSAIPSFPSIVTSGALQGTTLPQLLDQFGDQLTGQQCHFFPLLFKYIDATDKLSVQVHPDDASAHTFKWDISGKTECWYVVDADIDAGLITGFKSDVSCESICYALESGTLENLLNRTPVKAGELYFIPAGTVHAILGNSLIYEVQQSSDITFRFYDWNRLDAKGVPRELHIDEALLVVDMCGGTSYRIDPVSFNCAGFTHSYRMACRYFALEEYYFTKKVTVTLTFRNSMRVVSVVNGSITMYSSGKSVPVSKGVTVVIPFSLKDVSITGDPDTHVLITFIPEIEKDIVESLVNKNVSMDDIVRLGGVARYNDVCPFVGL